MECTRADDSSRQMYGSTAPTSASQESVSATKSSAARSAPPSNRKKTASGNFPTPPSNCQTSAARSSTCPTARARSTSTRCMSTTLSTRRARRPPICWKKERKYMFGVQVNIPAFRECISKSAFSRRRAIWSLTRLWSRDSFR
jgi:hypothetical protein